MVIVQDISRRTLIFRDSATDQLWEQSSEVNFSASEGSRGEFDGMQNSFILGESWE